MPDRVYESEVEEHAMVLLGELGYSLITGPEIGPDAPDPAKRERLSHRDVILSERLLTAMRRLNSHLPERVIEDVLSRLRNLATPDLVDDNRQFHDWLCHGVPVEYSEGGEVRNAACYLIDFESVSANDWLAVNQFTVIEDGHNRRPDIVLFVNGLPIAVIELKNAADEAADIEKAYQQLQTYKSEIRSLFVPNLLLMVSDGLYARFGSISADWSRFGPWRTVDGERIIEKGQMEMEVMIQGLLAPAALSSYLRHFVVFEAEEAKTIKKIAGYHQFHAVKKALRSTIRASGSNGDRRIGVVWHTQGSGKSLSMVYYSGAVVAAASMNNPTIVVVTDRQDLDGQLHGTFSRCAGLLRQTPVQAESCKDLMEKLSSRASGGIIFTTIQKFAPEDGSRYPTLSERRNIVVIADEAHRSQYGMHAKYDARGEESYGFAKYLRDALPHASFIGFTGTPIDFEDKSTRNVFGDYIDVYDIQRAVDDGATVRIFYEGRLAKLDLPPELQPQVDDEFEEVTEGEEDTVKDKLKSKWSAVEAVVGTEKRLRLIANDIDEHFGKRCESLEGKGMIVCMSRRICADMYRYMTELHPEWHDDAVTGGAIKVIMTASASDPPELRRHAPSKQDKKTIENRFKDPNDPLKLVIVCDMWLTGFDVPCLHSMYLDKPMKGHNLMQAIARVNRVFRDKKGGLIVDYIGIAGFLKKALKTYTESGGRGAPTYDQQQAVDALEEQIEVVRGIMYGFDYMRFFDLPPGERLSLVPAAMEHILVQEDGKKRFLDNVSKLTTAYSLAMPREEAQALTREVAYFQLVRAALVKSTVTEARTTADLESAIRQIISKAISSNEIVDVFSMAGITTPEIGILTDEFLAEVQNMKHKNLAVEALRRLLQDQISSKMKNNVIQQRSFFDMLNSAVKKYTNRALTTAEVLNELIEMAKTFNEAVKRGEAQGLGVSELSFYDALASNDSAKEVLGDERLKELAVLLVEKVRASASIDWTIKESVRAQMRNIVKRLLRQFGYPPDKRDEAIRLVLMQAEALAKEWALVA